MACVHAPEISMAPSMWTDDVTYLLLDYREMKLFKLFWKAARGTIMSMKE